MILADQLAEMDRIAAIRNGFEEGRAEGRAEERSAIFSRLVANAKKAHPEWTEGAAREFAEAMLED